MHITTTQELRTTAASRRTIFESRLALLILLVVVVALMAVTMMRAQQASDLMERPVPTVLESMRYLQQDQPSINDANGRDFDGLIDTL